MAYYSEEELKNMGIRFIGKNVKISTKASLYFCDQIEIGDNSRIDDFCIVSGKVKIGRNVHITPFCLLDAGDITIVIEDFSTLAYRVTIFTRSDDYSGETLTNSTIPLKYRFKTKKEPVIIKKQSIIGAGSIIFPGVTLEEGTSIGAMSLVTKSTQPWSIYFGIPAKKIKDRMKLLLEQEKEYLNEYNN